MADPDFPAGRQMEHVAQLRRELRARQREINSRVVLYGGLPVPPDGTILPPLPMSAYPPPPILDPETSDDDRSRESEAAAAPDGAAETPQGTEQDDEGDEQCEPGMRLGKKMLYSGKEDKTGRFKWQSTLPKDIGRPVEDQASSKWAIVVRNMRVYNDPRKVLAIHSILVQSPPLQNILKTVLKGYPGVTAGLQRLEFSGKFEPLIHRWGNLKTAIAGLDESTEEGSVAKKHAQLLEDLLQSELGDVLSTSQDMLKNGVMTFEHLWILFQPGIFLYTKRDGQDSVVLLSRARYGKDQHGNTIMVFSTKYIEFDGTKFGTTKSNLHITSYKGTRSITSLPVYPLDFHTNKAELVAKLIERGAKFEALAGTHYRAYKGVGWKWNMNGQKDKFKVEGRIVIDTYGWNNFNPNYPVFVTPLPTIDQASVEKSDKSEQADKPDDDADVSNENSSPEADKLPGADAMCEEDDDDDGCGECDGFIPEDGHFAEEDESGRAPLTKDQKMMCSPIIRGYSLLKKQWLNFFVNSVKDIEWSTGAFENLVLPANRKELILGFTESQQSKQSKFDDYIEGKGKGIILLLCGPPGVGKTLTAESLAEEMRVPLYMLAAGDVGIDAHTIETTLQTIMDMCTRWGAILLLDEADIFLEKRSLHDLQRNKLVTVFLRVIEYFQGIFIMSTNAQVENFDPAFYSRIHISLEYPELNAESRAKVWRNFLRANGPTAIANDLTDAQIDQLALIDMNGRQIKNCLKTAQLLACRKDTNLTADHIKTVLEVTQHLHNSSRATEETRASLFA